jgi:hypothetical protein
MRQPVSFSAHALLILEERLREQEAEGRREAGEDGSGRVGAADTGRSATTTRSASERLKTVAGIRVHQSTLHRC